MNISCLLLGILILILICIHNRENFNYGYGKSFGQFYHPRVCLPSQNCFQGTYLRSQQYHNVCPPKYGRLNREKIQLQDDCQRRLGNYPPSKYEFKCHLDNHLRRRCYWKQNYKS